MSFFAKTLLQVAQRLIVYAGIPTIFIGMFGSLMVMFLFRPKLLCDSPCSIYLIVNGILSFFFVPLYYLPIIMIFGFQMNILSLSGSICKFQMSYTSFTVTSVFLINCLISFDRYAISSRSARVRSFSSKKLYRYLVSIYHDHMVSHYS